jgi:hypothetical protein
MRLAPFDPSQGEHMRPLYLASCTLFGLVAACGSNALSTGGADLSIAPDLAMAPDLALSSVGPIDLASHSNKIFCGAQICDLPMVCCYTQAPGGGLNVTAACVNPGSCGDGGLQGSCDGPADCTGSKPSCCLDFSLGGGSQFSGGAQCTADCAAKADQTGGATTLTTKLCYSNADCAGYSGSVKGLTLPFDNCCSRNGIPVHFCAPPASLAKNAYTCP